MSALALAALLAAAPLHARDEDAQVVHLVYTGGTPGLGSGGLRFETLDKVRYADGIEIVEVSAFHGTLRQGAWTLRSEGRDVASVVALLEGGDLTCGAPERVPGFSSGLDTLLLDDPPDAALAVRLQDALGPPTDFMRRACTTPDGHAGELIGPWSVDHHPAEDLARFEFVLALQGRMRVDGEVHAFTLTGHPVQDGSRTVARALGLLEELPNALYVDTGGLTRGAPEDLAERTLRRLDPAALAPGEAELLDGARAFVERAEGLPYIATNWEAEDPALALPRSRVVELNTPDGPLRVAFIALLSPGLADRLPGLTAEGVTLRDPVAAARDEVLRLTTGADRPHAIIALTDDDPLMLRDLRVNVRGVDVLVGDPSFATLRVERTRVDLRPLSPEAKGAAVTVAADGLAVLSLHLHRGRLSSIEVVPERVYDHLPVDPEITAAVTRARAEAPASLDALLLPAPPGDPISPWPQDEWATLVCEALRVHLGADSVLLGPLPPVGRVPGPQTARMVADALDTPDVLELHRVPGSRLQPLLDKSYGLVETSCGAAPGEGAARAWGRGIDPDRAYTVLTTRHTRTTGPLQPLMASATATGPLDPPATLPLLGADGQPLTLQEGVLRALRALEASPQAPDPVAWLLEQAPRAQPPQWTLRARQLSLRLDQFTGRQDERFAQVPETLLNSPDSLTLALASDLSVEYNAPSLAWDVRLRSAYTRLSVREEDEAGSDPSSAVQESADDWRLSTSLTAPALAFPAAGPLKASPYGELLFDSEFTPTLAEDGLPNPRQTDLSLTLGLSASPWRFMRTLRLGGFANQDLALAPEKPLEFGGRVDLAAAWTVPPGLRIGLTGDVQVFASRVSDDSDLRARAWGELRLSAPASRVLSLSVYAQGLAVYGRGPNNRAPAGTSLVGVALDLRGATTRTQSLLEPP